MKYIKHYDSIEYELKEGDLVICNQEKYLDDVKNFINNNIGKIIHKHKDGQYRIAFAPDPNMKNSTKNFFHINPAKLLITTLEKSQVRKATQEEIEEYYIKKDANKYNL